MYSDIVVSCSSTQSLPLLWFKWVALLGFEAPAHQVASLHPVIYLWNQETCYKQNLLCALISKDKHSSSPLPYLYNGTIWLSPTISLTTLIQFQTALSRTIYLLHYLPLSIRGVRIGGRFMSSIFVINCIFIILYLFQHMNISST